MVVAADLLVSQNAISDISDALSYKRRQGYLNRVGGRSQFQLDATSDLLTVRDQSNALKLFAALQKHSEYIRSSAQSLFLQFFESDIEEIPVTFAGIESEWTRGEVDKFMGIRMSAISTVHGNIFKPVDDLPNTGWFELAQLIPSNPQGLLAEAYARTRKQMLERALAYNAHYHRDTNRVKFNGAYITDSAIGETIVSTSSSTWRSVSKIADTLLKPPPAGSVWAARADILAERAASNASAEAVRRQLSMDNFTKYWGDMKGRMGQFVNEQEVRASFSAIPLLPSGTASSRTWGIEVETVQAQYVSRPAGWDERSDGSLESIDYDDCTCDCDSCVDYGEHGECGNDGCGSSCAEYVSPILNHFNSSGLREICTSLDGKPFNSTPGIHVHVGAGDLSVVDVARLVRAYSAVSTYIWPLMDREVTGYCKDVSSNNVSHWLAASRRTIKQFADASATDVVYQQPDDRYRDLNLQALRQHGTIEFRAMGPTYDYEHLVRWAWFCREMVNVSRLDLPQSTWTQVRSMADVLGILTKYGSEGVPENWIAAESGLSVEEDSEAESE